MVVWQTHRPHSVCHEGEPRFLGVMFELESTKQREGRCHNRMQPSHVCRLKVARLKGNNLRHCPRRAMSVSSLILVILRSEFLNCFCKRDWEMIRCSSAFLE